MSFIDILYLSLRNLRQAKLRAVLTTMGVVVGVAVIVTMVSFGLGLQRNMLARFKALDLFNEISVFGRGLSNLASAGFDRNAPRNTGEGAERPRFRPDKNPTRVLDDNGVSEIASIPGVAYVEPNIRLVVYVRATGKALLRNISGATVPNSSSRFQQFAAGNMISSASADEALVNEGFTRDFGFVKPADAVGKTIEFLTADETANPSKGTKEKNSTEEPTSFFGIPFEAEESHQAKAPSLVAHEFRIAGVLDTEVKEGAGQGGFRGLMQPASVYIPLQTARQWTLTHRGSMSQVALALARQSGALSKDEVEGYESAVVRVTDPVQLTEVRKRLTDLGVGSFSIVDQMEQIRTLFLIIDSVLGLLGGISLLVASFGIANTMIMSILERTREIGIMKAIGAEDREIKLIFFVEAAVIGLTGGVIGTLVAWGIDGVANRAAYRFVLKPQGHRLSISFVAALPSGGDFVCPDRPDPGGALSGNPCGPRRSGTRAQT
jgi:putative ABC transport system permease protein